MRALHDEVQSKTRQPADPTWEELCKKIVALEGKTAVLQLTSRSQLFERGKLVTVTTRYIYCDELRTSR
jgi:hypothetical protein